MNGTKVLTHFSTLSVTLLVVIAAASAASAHDDHCAAVTESVADAGFDKRVTVTCTDSHAIIQSDTYPDHEKMTGIVGTNEQVPVPADYAAPILLAPTLGTTPLTRDAALGVAVNGVPIYDYTGGGEMSQADLAHHQAQHDTIQTGQLDVCGGHAGRGDDYHYHVKPTCMIDADGECRGRCDHRLGLRRLPDLWRQQSRRVGDCCGRS